MPKGRGMNPGPFAWGRKLAQKIESSHISPAHCPAKLERSNFLLPFRNLRRFQRFRATVTQKPAWRDEMCARFYRLSDRLRQHRVNSSKIENRMLAAGIQHAQVSRHDPIDPRSVLSTYRDMPTLVDAILTIRLAVARE